MKYINRAFLRFLFFALINTGFTYLVYLLCLELFPYLVAYTISYLSGILVSYLLNSVFVFKTPLHWKKALQFPLVYLVQYLLGSVLISISVEVLGIQETMAALLNVVILLPISFILSRFILTKKPKPEHT
jgi:putative flippase GtrA